MRSGNCFSCTIGIGKGHIEPRLYPVGDKNLCWWCKNELEYRGRLKIISEEDRRGVEHRVVYLFANGTTQEIKDEG